MQEVQATRHGDLAEIELHEVYESTATWDSYSAADLSLYFALPESAVVTGMWLGGSSDRSQAEASAPSPITRAGTVPRPRTSC